MNRKSLNCSTVESSANHPTITCANRQRTKKINLPLLKQIAAALVGELGIKPAGLGIYLVGAPEMTRLNGTFLRHAGSTDVIAFDYRDDSDPGGQRSVAAPKSGVVTKQCPPAVHGEIFICIDEALVQARKFGMSWPSELVRYLVHGTLHLIGHDDQHPVRRRKMKREENRLLGRLSRRFALAQLARPARIRA